MIQQSYEFVRLTALRDQDRDVGFSDDSEVAVEAFRWMKESRGRTCRCQCRGDLSSDVTGLANARHDCTAGRSGEQFHSARKIVSEAPFAFLQCFPFHAHDASPALDDFGVLHRWTFSQSETRRLS